MLGFRRGWGPHVNGVHSIHCAARRVMFLNSSRRARVFVMGMEKHGMWFSSLSAVNGLELCSCGSSPTALTDRRPQ